MIKYQSSINNQTSILIIENLIIENCLKIEN